MISFNVMMLEIKILFGVTVLMKYIKCDIPRSVH